MNTDDERFRVYHAAVAGRPPRPTLLRALAAFDAENRVGFAVDLGAGEGRDAIVLLQRGWSVLAIDNDAAALAHLRARRDLPPGARLVTLHGSFVDTAWPQADLVNAGLRCRCVRPNAFPKYGRGCVPRCCQTAASPASFTASATVGPVGRA